MIYSLLYCLIETMESYFICTYNDIWVDGLNIYPEGCELGQYRIYCISPEGLASQQIQTHMTFLADVQATLVTVLLHDDFLSSSELGSAVVVSGVFLLCVGIRKSLWLHHELLCQVLTPSKRETIKRIVIVLKCPRLCTLAFVTFLILELDLYYNIKDSFINYYHHWVGFWNLP